MRYHALLYVILLLPEPESMFPFGMTILGQSRPHIFDDIHLDVSLPVPVADNLVLLAVLLLF